MKKKTKIPDEAMLDYHMMIRIEVLKAEIRELRTLLENSNKKGKIIRTKK